MNYETIKSHAVQLVEDVGLINLTCAGLCEACGIKPGSFTYYAGKTFRELVDDLRASGHTGPAGVAVERQGNPQAGLRREQIIDAGLELALESGLHNVERGGICERASVSPALVNHYFGRIEQVREQILERAIERRSLPVIAQALAARHPAVAELPDDLKLEAIATL